MKFNGKTIAILIAFLVVPFLAQAARFQRFDFKVRGEITDVITEDLNNDGLREAIVIHIDKSVNPPRRLLTIYYQDRKTGFDKNRKVEWVFPREVAVMGLGDVRPDPGKELVFITERGVSYATVLNGKVSELKEILKVQSVVAIPYERDVPYYNFVRDYTGDGKDDILVCGFYEALFARQGPNYAFTTSKLHLRPSMEIDAFAFSGMLGGQEHPMFRVAYYVPQIYSEDYNADGLRDLIVSFRHEVLIFAQNKSGFTADPVKRYRIRLLPENPSRRRSAPNFFFRDLDGDRRADILVNETFGDLNNMRSRTALFYGKSSNIEKGVPDVEFKTRYPAMGVYVQDVNKDGLPDIIIPTIDFGAWTAGKALITGDINVEWNYFLQNANRRFSPSPTRTLVTTLKFNVSKFRLESGIPNIFADFNGDGFPDQALGDGKQALVITLRDGQGKALPIVERITIPVSISMQFYDLNKDGRADLLIYYRDQSDMAGDFHIFLNRGPWK